MTNWTLITPANPTNYELARAIENRKEKDIPYIPLELPHLSYPPSLRMNPTPLKAFLSEIKNILNP